MTGPPDPAGYPVTIARIEVKLDNALAEHAAHARASEQIHKDHEDRLRAGERWRWAMPITLLVALAGAGAGYAQLFGK